MRKSTRGAWFALIFCVFNAFYIPVAQAITMDDITTAASLSGDKSKEALVTIFGQVVNDPLATSDSGSETMIAAVFKTTNACFLAVAGFMSCYMLSRKIMQAGHDGSMFDKAQHVSWGPIRMLFGISTLVPTANGWCLSQLLMLWASSIMGIGIANIGTFAGLDAFSSGKAMIVQPVSPDTKDLARALFEANLCRSGINASLKAVENAGGEVRDADFVNQVLTNDSTGFILKSKYYVCGGANSSPADSETSSSTSKSTNLMRQESADIRNAHIEALSQMESTLYDNADKFVQAVVDRQNGSDAALPNSESIITEAAENYENTMTEKLRDTSSSLGELATQLNEQIREQGWFALGSWYQTFAEANTNVGNAAATKGQAFGRSTGSTPPVKDVYDSVWTAYTTQQSILTNSGAITATSSFNGSDTEGGVFHTIFSTGGQKFTNLLINMDTDSAKQVNPVISMKNLGDYIIDVADTALGVYMTAQIASGASESVVGKLADWFTGLPSMLKAGLTAVSPFIVIIIIALFSIGATLSLYIPFAPFIIWFSSCINWLVIVGEAVVAAPLWSLTHLHADGEGMGQKTTHGYIFLLNVMVRPILMVIGFFLGGAIVQVGGTFLNSQFSSVIANSQFDSMSGIVSLVWWVFIYCSICITLIHSSFSLIYIVPDQVINWVGGYASPNLGRDTANSANNAAGQLGDKSTAGFKEGMSKVPENSAPPPSGNGVG
ncbi:TPA: DotA/TraY family protein [Salmonella enterica subsp. salamae serovar 35:g,m,s,t:-]|nr:DotA/TraY family protein [Salmonella enterica subsp. salamae serovar 35:g,m,s,t:-]HCA3549750.1 DotA/TraY family protein [Salmonella enterica subsp. salamae serovar 35:g,m,s,t:-]